MVRFNPTRVPTDRYNRRLMPAELLPVQSRRAERMKRIQTLQHVAAAFLLALAAFDHLRSPHGHDVLLPGLELAAGAALITAAIRERLRHWRGLGHDHVAWIEIAGAAMSFVEAIHRLYEPHHLSFRIVSFVQPAMLLLFAFFDVRLQSFRYLKVDDEDFVARLRLILPRKQVALRRVQSFRMTGDGVTFLLDDGGTQVISLRDIKDLDGAKGWLRAQLIRRDLVESAAP
jgi:hypothetical protein